MLDTVKAYFSETKQAFLGAVKNDPAPSTSAKGLQGLAALGVATGVLVSKFFR